jgi:hypothetical protein
VKVNSSDRTIATSMRNVVRAAYCGRCTGSSEIGCAASVLSGCPTSRLALASTTTRPKISSAASRSQRLGSARRANTESAATGKVISQEPGPGAQLTPVPVDSSAWPCPLVPPDWYPDTASAISRMASDHSTGVGSCPIFTVA